MSNSGKSIFLPPSQTRLVTIAAHVDHGKTTLADNLIEHNGIISERLAGTLRYMDSNPEEQRRGITMKSSAIGLSHFFQAPAGAKKKTTTEPNGPRIIHLVDSPGHTDFSWHVSSALQACDACLLVVDAVEGMGPRTHQVFREALVHQLVPVLVINKMDRLCTHLGLTPTEAYVRTRLLLESVNAAASAMITSLHQQQEHEEQQMRLEEQEETKPNDNGKNTTNSRTKEQLMEDEINLWTFDPAKNNVVFGSALFGWGFTSTSLARSLFQQNRIPLKPLQLRPYIFGDFKYNPETNKVLKWKQQQQQGSDMPIFAEFGLQPLWDIYQGVATAAQAVGQTSALFSTNSSISVNSGLFGGSTNSNSPNDNNNQSTSSSSSSSSNKNKIKADSPGMDMVLEAMQMGPATFGKKGDKKDVAVAITTLEDLSTVLTKTGASTEESVLRSVLRRFRPLATTILDVVCDYCPSPQTVDRDAAGMIQSKRLSLQTPQTRSTAFDEIQTAVQTCDTSTGAPSVAYVCKFFSTDRSHVRDPNLAASTSTNATDDNQNDESILLGVTRVLSGTLRTGQEYHAFGPKHKENNTTTLKKAIRLYLLMGSSFVLVDEVPAGHLCAVFGLEDVQLKNLTLSDRPEAMPLSMAHMMQGTTRIRPLVKINIEAKKSSDVEELDRGLLKLSLADAAVEVTATARGERILACLGELHLEQSILDLKNVYCARRDIELRTSDPIVDFGETTDWFPLEVSDYKSLFPADNNNTSTALQQPRQSTIPPFNEEEGLSGAKFGRSRAVVSGRSAALRLRVVPLAESVHRAFQEKSLGGVEGSDAVDEDLEKNVRNLAKAVGLDSKLDDGGSLQDLFNQLLKCISSVGTNGNALMQTPNLENGIAVFGLEAGENGEVFMPPTTSDKSVGQEDSEDQDSPVNGKSEYEKLSLCLKDFRSAEKIKEDCVRNDALDEEAANVWKKMSGSAVAGFQLALRSGPLCEEPVRNVLVVLEGVEIAMKSKAESGYEPAKTLSSGMIVSALRSGIRCALLTRPARLMEGYLRLTLNATLAGLGALYSVLSKRRGKVLEDSMVDGTDLLAITALIPQAEAFGLAPELFAKTSGEVTAPEMTFSSWERLDVDPFWIPTTEEEREDYGELQTAGDSSTGLDNTALTYIRKVRERKGLKVDSSRTVVAAEKQRTLKR